MAKQANTVDSSSSSDDAHFGAGSGLIDHPFAVPELAEVCFSIRDFFTTKTSNLLADVLTNGGSSFTSWTNGIEQNISKLRRHQKSARGDEKSHIQKIKKLLKRLRASFGPQNASHAFGERLHEFLKSALAKEVLGEESGMIGMLTLQKIFSNIHSQKLPKNL